MGERFDDLPPMDESRDQADPYDWGQGASVGGKSKPAIKIRWHRDADPNIDRAWLVRELLPEIGKGLLSGQWGSAKTFIALDLSGSVITGQPFAGRRVLRRGGILFIAPEGAFEIPIRLKGLVQAKIRGVADADVDPDDLPFAWIEECPRLVEAEAGAILAQVAKQAADDLRDLYSLPLALIIVDTVAAGAGFDDENSAAETQKVMNALERLSQATGALVLGVDHFGKATETGTRGSSAKEAAADVVLAALATRDEAGTTSNMRMAVRKVRGARAGTETPYTLDIVQIGEDRFGEPVTTCVVAWHVDRTSTAATAAAKERWPVSLKILRAAMLTTLCEAGKSVRPYGIEGPEVRAVPQDAVRREFVAAYPADGETETQRAEAKRKAFNRAVKQAQGKALIQSRDLGGIDHLWLTQAEPPEG